MKHIHVAAFDSSSKDKKASNFVCKGEYDEVVLQAAIDALGLEGGKVILCSGDFLIGKQSRIRRWKLMIIRRIKELLK